MNDLAGRPSRPGLSGRRSGVGADQRTSGDTIASALAERVLSGELAPNDRLPPERQLALEFGVSRPIIREALRALVERGLIDVEPSRGAFVRGDSASGTRCGSMLNELSSISTNTGVAPQ